MAEGQSHRIKYPTVCCRCVASIASSRFDHIRAGEAGWFFTKAGDAYCPVHIPAWVAEWRARQVASP